MSSEPPPPPPRSRREAREAAESVQASPSVQASERAQSESSLDALFTEPEVASQPLPGQRSKRRRRPGCLIAIIVVLVLLGAAAGAGVWAWNTYGEKVSDVLGWGESKDYAPGLAHGEAIVTIRDGDTGNDVSRSLFEAGVTKTEKVFYQYLVDNAIAVTFYPGMYRLSLEMTAEGAVAAMRDPANRLEGNVLLREGLTLSQSLEVLADATDITLAEFEEAVKDPTRYGVSAVSLEGWLFPATYRIDPDLGAEQIIQILVDRAVLALDQAGVPVADRFEILTIASIIQREARYEKDFYRVSRVVQNRLDADMLLQMDSTAQFGFSELNSGTVSTSEGAQFDDNPWNTYVHLGLPITPIANPGDRAIQAAMSPEPGPWLYFVTIDLDTGETVFTETYEEHNAAIELWHQWCEANPDSGC